MIQFESYQSSAVEWLSTRRRGLVQSPAGSGKTIIAAGALDRVLGLKARERKVNVGWLCNTREQADQATKAIAEFPKLSDGCEFRIACSAANQSWSDCDVLIIDESHHGTAFQWSAQINSCRGALWGFTATPETGDVARDKALLDLFDQNLFVIPRSDVKRLVSATVIMLDAFDADGASRIDAEIDVLKRRYRSIPISDEERTRRAVWQAVSAIGIAQNTQRTTEGVRRALGHCSAKDQVLCLTHLVEHMQSIALDIPGSAALDSSVGRKRRRGALDQFRAGEINCLVATSLADEGLDLPNANVLVLFSGGKSRIKAEQRTGRVLRSFAGKTRALIYDFMDTPHRTMRRHAESRMQLYRELGYRIEDKNGVEI